MGPIIFKNQTEYPPEHLHAQARSAKCLPASLGSYGPDQILSHYSEIRAFVYPNISHVTIPDILRAHIYIV